MEQVDAMHRAVGWLREADGLIFAAGAGMGVDSGLPDFRGSDAIWAKWLPAGVSKADVRLLTYASSFRQKPQAAWRFYSRAAQIFRQTAPHAGFSILRRWGERAAKGAFVFTSNVDGHFQLAGFPEDRVVECHGTINFMQCRDRCSEVIWGADSLPFSAIEADDFSCDVLPQCPHCGGLARPNLRLSDDAQWVTARMLAQYTRLQAWRTGIQSLVVVELGAGLAVSAVRQFAEGLGAPLIRINLERSGIGAGEGVELCGSALSVLKELEQAWNAGAGAESLTNRYPERHGAGHDTRYAVSQL